MAQENKATDYFKQTIQSYLQRRAQEIVSLTDKTLLELSRKDEIVTGEIAIGGGETKACFFWRNG